MRPATPPQLYEASMAPTLLPFAVPPSPVAGPTATGIGEAAPDAGGFATMLAVGADAAPGTQPIPLTPALVQPPLAPERTPLPATMTLAQDARAPGDAAPDPMLAVPVAVSAPSSMPIPMGEPVPVTDAAPVAPLTPGPAATGTANPVPTEPVEATVEPDRQHVATVAQPQVEAGVTPPAAPPRTRVAAANPPQRQPDDVAVGQPIAQPVAQLVKSPTEKGEATAATPAFTPVAKTQTPKVAANDALPDPIATEPPPVPVPGADRPVAAQPTVANATTPGNASTDTTPGDAEADAPRADDTDPAEPAIAPPALLVTAVAPPVRPVGQAIDPAPAPATVAARAAVAPAASAAIDATPQRPGAADSDATAPTADPGPDRASEPVTDDAAPETAHAEVATEAVPTGHGGAGGEAGSGAGSGAGRDGQRHPAAPAAAPPAQPSFDALARATAPAAAPQGQPAPAEAHARASAIGADIGVAITRHVERGSDDVLVIRLDPAELGRIEVRLKLDDARQLSADLTADRPATLDLLRRDADNLTRALNDAGFRADDQSLRFDSRGSGQNDAQGQQQERRAATRAYRIEDEGIAPSAPTPVRVRSAGRVDLVA